MKIIIDIPEQLYKTLAEEGVDDLEAEDILNAVVDGQILPEDRDIIQEYQEIKRIYKNWLLFGLDEKKAFHKLDEIFLEDVLEEEK